MTAINTLSKLDSLSEIDDQTKPFGPYQEEAIISLALDHPEFFTGVVRFLKPTMFGRTECQYIIGHLLTIYEEHEVVPTRGVLRDKIEKELTLDGPVDVVLGLIERKSDYREVPIIKDTLLKWARERQFGLLYSEESIEAYHTGNYELLESIVNEANRISDVSEGGFWFLDNYTMLFETNAIEHRTTGFPRLDKVLNNGGPSPKEVLCWLAGTNVGKSLLLCNNAITSLRGSKGDGSTGQDVMLITFELDAIKTAMRCLGVTTGVALNQILDHKEFITRTMQQMKATYNRNLYIHELPPDECSVDHIYTLIANLKRRHGWKPDVIVIDYLDLMVSRNHHYNKDDYKRQKHIATEVRGLAKNENVLIFTATQTNRSGADEDELVDLTKSAESYGKQFPIDYVVSLNQSASDRAASPPRLRMYVAKNRNGPKFDIVTCEINYNTMLVKELL